MSYKRLIPCIFILGGKAVKWFDDPTVVSEDVIALAKEYSDNGADELLVFDLSNTDQDHDESIELMKKINRVIRIPMVAGGNVKAAGGCQENPLHRCKACHAEFFKAGFTETDRRGGKAVWKKRRSRCH